MNTKSLHRPPSRQTGMALVIVLLLLLVMTILGLASMRSTLMNERMSAAVYDRSLAFHLAETALREAEAEIRDATNPEFGVNCVNNTNCFSTPPIAFTSGAGGSCTVGTLNCWITLSEASPELSAGTAQYYIEYMGSYSTEDVLGLSTSANQAQYGGSGATPIAHRYRVTARSHDPVATPGRSVVVLQTTVARR